MILRILSQQIINNYISSLNIKILILRTEFRLITAGFGAIKKISLLLKQLLNTII
jgi:hypothetical protein